MGRSGGSLAPRGRPHSGSRTPSPDLRAAGPFWRVGSARGPRGEGPRPGAPHRGLPARWPGPGCPRACASQFPIPWHRGQTLPGPWTVTDRSLALLSCPADLPRPLPTPPPPPPPSGHSGRLWTSCLSLLWAHSNPCPTPGPLPASSGPFRALAVAGPVPWEQAIRGSPAAVLGSERLDASPQASRYASEKP